MFIKDVVAFIFRVKLMVNFYLMYKMRKKIILSIYVLMAASDLPNTSPVTSTPEGGAYGHPKYWSAIRPASLKPESRAPCTVAG